MIALVKLLRVIGRKGVTVKRSAFITLPLFLCFVLPLAVFAADENDWQYWCTSRVEIKLSGKWKAKIEEEFRSERNVFEPYYHHTEGAVNYKLNSWFSLELNYRHIYEKKGGEWNLESRPHVNGAFKWRWSKLAFENRSRFELRIRENKDNTWRYRNKTTLTHPVILGHLDFNPYISEEIFYDFDQGEMNRNRVYAGVKHSLIRSIGLDVYYLWQTTKSSSSWMDLNIMGVKLKVSV